MAVSSFFKLSYVLLLYRFVFFYFDTNAKWSYGRSVQFIDMQSFAGCSQRPEILFDIWYMGFYFIRKVRKEKIWKYVILGKAISLRGSARNENVRSETASDPHYQIGYKTRTNERILMKSTPKSVIWIVVSICNELTLKIKHVKTKIINKVINTSLFC